MLISRKSLISVLARSFQAGAPAIEDIALRAAATLGRPWQWLKPLARRYVALVRGKTRPRHRDVVRFLREDRRLAESLLRHPRKLTVHRWLAEPQLMQPVKAAEVWPIPAIESTGALADWLWLDVERLQWFADLKGIAARSDRLALQHYRYRLLAKASGSFRLIEAPKPRLKSFQRQILEWILDVIPPHLAVHGFVKGRSIRTFAAPHVAKRVILRMDLQDFFPTFTGARIQTFFRTLGYPEDVADLLGGICTNIAPASLLSRDNLPQDKRQTYLWPHLPQGAPTSPALANLCMYRADCRLSGLAKAAGAIYTRYADDLAFSGEEDFRSSVERFAAQAAAILTEEGLHVNHRKTRVMRQGVRQYLTGLVVNRKLNVPRTDFDRLKAILHNCVRFGPESQNHERHTAFQSHLEGRVAFVESIHPERGKRLRAIFEQIAW